MHYLNGVDTWFQYLCEPSECAGCHLKYCPDDLNRPQHFCVVCNQWNHLDCGGVKSQYFRSPGIHSKGLALTCAGTSPKAAPLSVLQCRSSQRARDTDLQGILVTLDEDLRSKLVSLASQCIVRPLPNDVVGNRTRVVEARMWLREILCGKGLSLLRGSMPYQRG